MSMKSLFFAVGLALAATPVWCAGISAPQAPAATPANQPSRTPPSPPRKPTAEERAEADRMGALARAAFWGHDLEVDPRDVEGAIKLAKALRELSRFDEAEAATAQALIMAPNSEEALLESARDYIAEGHGFFAIDPCTRAGAIAPKDWRPVSLLGIALEQAERGDEALAAFNSALALAPGNPAALTNLAMYYAAHGDSKQAEALLRQAVAAPGAGPRERQDLALIVGLSGRLDEAERLERQDLPPDVVANDLAYLRADATGVKTRSWDALSSAH
jgi:Flp pilus assembly protein TadD